MLYCELVTLFEWNNQGPDGVNNVKVLSGQYIFSKGSHMLELLFMQIKTLAPFMYMSSVVRSHFFTDSKISGMLGLNEVLILL